MLVFEIVVALLLAGAALAALARRIGAPYPALVALAGAALGLVPGVPTLALDPELVHALFIAPVLVDAAYDASPRDLRVNWRPVASLALGAVALTVGVVAVVVKFLVPDMPWGAAIALGAIVAPPDAAAATAVLKHLHPPHRLLVILEGESLFNDAGALLIYRLAVGATMTGNFSGWSVVPTLFLVTAGSVLLGIALSKLSLSIHSRIADVSTAVIVQFCGAFGVWIIAERFHLSGVITAVVFAMASAREAPVFLAARIRVPSWAVWQVAVFVLNVLAFILIGFQLKDVSARIAGAQGMRYVLVAVVVCATVILARIAWVTAAAALRRRVPRLLGEKEPTERAGRLLSARGAAVVGWCGMRGTITLATALALPSGGEGAFPYRDLILICAFGVVLGTLVVQGLTLRPLMAWLDLREDDAVEREVRLARVETLRAAVAAARDGAENGTARLIRRRYEVELRRAEDDASCDGKPTDANGSCESAADAERDADARVVEAALSAQRRRLIALRDEGTIGDAAFQRVEEELDWMELGWGQVIHPAESPTERPPEGDHEPAG